MVKFLILILKKVKGIFTARPKSVNLSEGEVVLRNLPKERQDELEAIITKWDGGELKVMPENNEEIKSNDTSHLKQVAVSFMKNSTGSWELVKVLFNPETKEATVSKVESLDKDFYLAKGKFIFELTKLFFKFGG